MIPHYRVMPKLNGSRVRHRVAAKDWDLSTLSEATGIPEGTLKNATREHDPQPVSLRRVYRLIDALDLPLGELVAASSDGVPDSPPPQPDKGPKGPPRRDEKDTKGPSRVTDRAEAVA